ncbi:MAG: methyltransferase domain-containing protein [Planctomycetes bacterium]|nr:methyltransferase domain-containing protein [Planctomycetota bacterium]
MSLADLYHRQLAWRDWRTAFAALPPLEGAQVLDLGCGPGDLAAELAARGARVLGVDANEELVEVARARGIPNAAFRAADLRSLEPLERAADGIWCSFSAAYFVEFAPVLERWRRLLRPGGWIALVEIDDLFAHEPVTARTRERFASYAEEARTAGRYDFHMGRTLDAHLSAAGFLVERRFELADRELAFDGLAPPEVVDAWRARLERMRLLHSHCGAEYASVRDDFLACLGRPDHRSAARVIGRVAIAAP